MSETVFLNPLHLNCSATCHFVWVWYWVAVLGVVASFSYPYFWSILFVKSYWWSGRGWGGGLHAGGGVGGRGRGWGWVGLGRFVLFCTLPFFCGCFYLLFSFSSLLVLVPFPHFLAPRVRDPWCRFRRFLSALVLG